MSAFMVSDDCIQNILSLAAGWTKPGVKQWKPFIDAAFDDVDGLGQRLLELNAQAIRARYGDRAEPLIGQTTNQFVWRMNYAPLLPAIKALDCWLYQCTEGDVPQRELYQQMRDLRDTACQSYVSAQPEYDAADWG